MSDFGLAEIALAPSRTRRLLLTCAGGASLILACVLEGALCLLAAAPAHALGAAALACALGGALALRAAFRPGPVLRLRFAAAALSATPGGVQDTTRARLRRAWRRIGAGWPVAAPGCHASTQVVGLVLAAGARAPQAGTSRIVLWAEGTRVVVWRDATDRDSFRRLAAWARWGAGRA